MDIRPSDDSTRIKQIPEGKESVIRSNSRTFTSETIRNCSPLLSKILMNDILSEETTLTFPAEGFGNNSIVNLSLIPVYVRTENAFLVIDEGTVDDRRIEFNDQFTGHVAGIAVYGHYRVRRLKKLILHRLKSLRIPRSRFPDNQIPVARR